MHKSQYKTWKFLKMFALQSPCLLCRHKCLGMADFYTDDPLLIMQGIQQELSETSDHYHYTQQSILLLCSINYPLVSLVQSGIFRFIITIMHNTYESNVNVAN